MSGVRATTRYVGRQAIFDRRQRVVGYELLHRSGDENRAAIHDGTLATSEALVGALIDIDIDRILGPHPGFVNMPRELLVSGRALALPPDRMVIEVLEDVEADDEVVAALEELRDAGYRIALDDYVDLAHQRELLALVDIVKLDVGALGTAAAADLVPRLREHDIQLLAEKVETHDDFRHLRVLGFEYFQGYYLARPDIIRGKRMAQRSVNGVRLLAQLSDDEVGFSEVADSIALDAGLSFRLLRLLNSPFYGRRKRVESVHDGLVMIGQDRMRHWVAMIVLGSMTDKPPVLVELGLIRARHAESLARASGLADPRAAFTVGLFSIIDALTDQPMEALLAQVPLRDDVVQAVLHHAGELGRILAVAIAQERFDIAALDDLAIDPDTVSDTYAEAVAWADEYASAMAGTDSRPR